MIDIGAPAHGDAAGVSSTSGMSATASLGDERASPSSDAARAR